MVQLDIEDIFVFLLEGKLPKKLIKKLTGKPNGQNSKYLKHANAVKNRVGKLVHVNFY